MSFNFLKTLAAEQYNEITFESFKNALNPFGQGNIETVFDFAFVALRTMVSLVGILAVFYVIYGGYKYMISAGNPEETKKAKNTIIWAIIGIAASTAAAVGISYILGVIGGPVATNV